MSTHYDFKDDNNDLWHFRETQDAQGVLYSLYNVDGGLVASALEMHMPFDEWVMELIQGMMHYAD